MLEKDSFLRLSTADCARYKNRDEFVDRAVWDKLIETRAHMEHVNALARADHIKIADFAYACAALVERDDEGLVPRAVGCFYDSLDFIL